MTQQEYDHNRYMGDREARIHQSMVYRRDYASKGLRKPRTSKTPEERKARRKYMEHQRYLRNREDILAKQKVYRETHKEQIRERRRKRDFERIYGRPYD